MYASTKKRSRSFFEDNAEWMQDILPDFSPELDNIVEPDLFPELDNIVEDIREISPEDAEKLNLGNIENTAAYIFSEKELEELPCDELSIPAHGPSCYITSSTLLVARTLLHMIEDEKIRQYLVDAYHGQMDKSMGPVEENCPNIPHTIRQLYKNMSSAHAKHKKTKHSRLIRYHQVATAQPADHSTEDPIQLDRGVGGWHHWYLSSILFAEFKDKHIFIRASTNFILNTQMLLLPDFKIYTDNGYETINHHVRFAFHDPCPTVSTEARMTNETDVYDGPIAISWSQFEPYMNDLLRRVKVQNRWKLLGALIEVPEHVLAAFPCKGSWMFCDNYFHKRCKLSLQENGPRSVLSLTVLYSQVSRSMLASS